MRAVVCHQYGPPEGLVVERLPVLTPGTDEVLVDVGAAAVNFPDVLLVANAYQVPMALPFVPGSEFAGRVAEVGEGVSDFAPGDPVFGVVGSGAFAEQALAPAGQLVRIPDGVGLAEAAAFGVTYRTAYHALRSVAGVRAGDWVVVLGAAGGVGLAAVDLAVRLGARVVAAASGPEKLDLCRKRGATGVIDYTTEDLRLRIKELTSGGAHVVIDPVGGEWSEQALRAMRWGGVFVTLGFAAGTIPAIPLNLVLLKGVTVQGLDIRTFGSHDPGAEQRDVAELMRLLAAGEVRPHIGARFPLEDSAAALRFVADRKALGKVVIDIGGGGR